jgi:hypothetical protein
MLGPRPSLSASSSSILSPSSSTTTLSRPACTHDIPAPVFSPRLSPFSLTTAPPVCTPVVAVPTPLPSHSESVHEGPPKRKRGRPPSKPAYAPTTPCRASATGVGTCFISSQSVVRWVTELRSISLQQEAAQSAFPQPIPPHPSTPTPRLFVCITLLFPFEQNALHWCGSLPGSKSSTGLSHF